MHLASNIYTLMDYQHRLLCLSPLHSLVLLHFVCFILIFIFILAGTALIGNVSQPFLTTSVAFGVSLQQASDNYALISFESPLTFGDIVKHLCGSNWELPPLVAKSAFTKVVASFALGNVVTLSGISIPAGIHFAAEGNILGIKGSIDLLISMKGSVPTSFKLTATLPPFSIGNLKVSQSERYYDTYFILLNISLQTAGPILTVNVEFQSSFSISFAAFIKSRHTTKNVVLTINKNGLSFTSTSVFFVCYYDFFGFIEGN